MLGGFKFTLKLEAIRANVFTGKKIIKQHIELPQLQFEIGVIAVLMNIQNANVNIKVLVKEIKLLDYYKREMMRAFSRAVHNGF